jgi:hypothetical protein
VLLQLKHLFDQFNGMVWPSDRVPVGSLINVYLKVVASLETLVTEGVDCFVLDISPLFLGFNMSKIVCLVPASWKDIKGDLTSNRVSVRVSALIARGFVQPTSARFQETPPSMPRSCSFVYCAPCHMLQSRFFPGHLHSSQWDLY